MSRACARWQSVVVALLSLCALAVTACGEEEKGGSRVEGTEPADCSDGADNDRDGRIDCYDDGCATSAACGDSDVVFDTQDANGDTAPTDTLPPGDTLPSDTGAHDTGAQVDSAQADTAVADTTTVGDTATASDTQADAADTNPDACTPACGSTETCIEASCAPEFVFTGTSLSRGIAAVAVGGVVSFRNGSSFDTHSVDFDDASMTDGAPLASGQQAVLTFPTAGTWNFRCGQHPARIQEAAAVVVTP